MNTKPCIPTLSDVAKAAGVSTATVSRCLNENQKVSAKTVEMVMKAVEELGYTPNYHARAMAAKQSHTVGAIIPTMENAIFARGLQAFQETLFEQKYNLLVSSSAYQPKREAQQIRELVARGADGLLLIGFERDEAIYDFLAQRDIPVVLAWASRQNSDHAYVGFDNRAAMRMLTDKVIEMGHRQIGIISGITEGNDRAAERLAGIKDSWQAHGGSLDELAIVQTPYDTENGGVALKQLVQATPRPSVIICGNDVLATGAISKARDLGIKVPDDISITGFDDIELAKHVSPALTTVHVPHRQMGHIAAKSLINLIEKKGEKAFHQLDVFIEMRASLKRISTPGAN